MRFSLVALTLSAAISVQAAAFSKRAVRAQVQQCIDDLSAVDSQIVVVQNLLCPLACPPTLTAANAVHAQEQILEDLIDDATDSCCALSSLSPAVTEEEADAALGVIGDIVSHIEPTLDCAGAKAGCLGLIIKAIFVADLKALRSKTTSLTNCLIAVTPASRLATAQIYVDAINTAFADVYAAYGI